MKHCESYAHRYAKETLAAWFREKWIINRENGYPNSYFIFDWSPDNDDGDHGIKMEYPILKRKLKNGEEEILGVSSVWSSYPIVPENSEELRVEAILDIGVCSKGKLVYGFEIVHKHPCTPKKIVFLKELHKKYGLRVYEINASWILDQIRRPSRLDMLEIT